MQNWVLENDTVMDIGNRWAEVDKNRDKPRICFPSLRLAFHPAKALRE